MMRRAFSFSPFEEDFFDFFKRIEGEFPKELIREEKLPDGSVRKEYGPFIYGYSVRIGPDGKPVVREFGNVKRKVSPVKPVEVKEATEPLVDVITEEDKIKVIAEVPGVDKQDIKLNVVGKTLSIRAESERRKYSKDVELPEEVDPKTAKASYKNGILEVTLSRVKKEERKGEEIPIE
ncbi:MAG: Hsp20/alpha crystallin family protein [Candidatus Brockarchaeota archaeon]|nr:Hsp20/alpha crystallin family protein [Candidatus Brockarchaeota archaeon]